MLEERCHELTGQPVGMVDAQGTCRFASDDINQCRRFLRGLGLEIGPNPRDGWRKREGLRNDAWLGLIDYWDGKWHAAAWRRDDIEWNDDGYVIKEARR